MFRTGLLSLLAASWLTPLQAGEPARQAAAGNRALSWVPGLAATPPAGAGSAQLPPAGVPWTLARALARAMEANPDLLAAKHEFERLEGVRLQIRSQLLPSVAVSAGVNERQQSLVDESPSQRAAPPSPETAVALYGYDVRLEVRQLVFDGLSAWNQTKRQQFLRDQSYLGLRMVVARTANLARQGFDTILLRQEVLAAEVRRVEEWEQLLAWTERKRAVGEIPEFELLRAQAELQGARADRADAERALGEAEQAFRRLLQIPDDPGPLLIEGRLVRRAFGLPLAEAVAQARANRPDLEAAELAVAAARRNQLAQAGSYLPRVEVFASYGARSSYYNSGYRLDGWTIGASGQWSLFDGGQSRGRRLSLLAERRSAEVKLADVQHQIASQLRELYQGLEHARAAVEAQEKGAELSERALSQARRMYDEGEAALEQVLQAEMTARRSRSRAGEAVLSYNNLVGQIEFAVGGQLADSVGRPETWKP